MTEPIKLPEMSFDLYHGIRDLDQYKAILEYARLAVEQATADLRAELASCLGSMDYLAGERNEAIFKHASALARAHKAEADLAEARSELARLTTLRPASEHDGKPAVWWLNSAGNWLRISESRFGMDGCYWTPLPPVKEADK